MRPSLVLVVVVVVVVVFAFAACKTPEVVVAAKDAKRTVRVVSWNVNYGLAGDPAAFALLKNLDADVVLLQETNEAWNAQLKAKMRDKYPFIETHACCGAGGLAVLSKRRIVSVDIIDPVSWFPAARVVVDTPIGKVQALDVHLRPPFSDNGSIVSGYFTTPSVRQDEMTAFAAALETNDERPPMPTIVVGDFNEESGGATKVLRDSGFVDALPVFDSSTPTWRWNVASVEIHGRLDHVFYQRGTVAPVDVHVVEGGNSDHFPIVAVLAAAPSQT